MCSVLCLKRKWCTSSFGDAVGEHKEHEDIVGLKTPFLSIYLFLSAGLLYLSVSYVLFVFSLYLVTTPRQKLYGIKIENQILPGVTT